MPMTTPANVYLFLKFSFQLGLSNTKNQMGDDAIKMATKELARYCSARITAPLPKNNIRKPLIMEGIIAFLFHTFSFLEKAHNSIKDPDAKKRMPPKTIGATYFTASSIKKYVDPQIIYTAAKASHTTTTEGVFL